MRLHTIFARLCLTVSLLLGVGHVKAATITFNGATIAGCSISGNQYTCPSFNGSDDYTIASGYSVIVNSGFTPQWAQIFTMSGTAALTVKGNISFNSINPSNLKVNGGTIIAEGGSFVAGSGNGTVLGADITATSVTLGGTSIKATGNITATGIVDISAGSSVSGTINGGTVTLGSNVTAMKDITATGKLTINSGVSISGALKGNEVIVGPDVKNITSITADGALTIGSRTTISGAISAASVAISSDAKVGGGITSRGNVQLDSRVNVTGPIAGTTITTDSSVVINGNVTASISLAIGSASQIKGNLTSPVIALKASSLVVTGDVKALNTLTIESGNSIIGNVEGGRVTLNDSESFITGNALVDHITFGYHGRVQQTITCKAYTPSDPCSCVTDNSKYPTNDAYYRKCGPGVQSGPHHFEISHPASALSCSPEKVTVKACADASCGSVYTNGATVVLSPGGATAQTGNTGSVDSTVAQYAGGTATLSLTSTPSTTGALVCKNSTTGNTTNCQMPFNSSGLQVTADPRYAEDAQPVSISAVQASGSNPKACVPLFANQDKTIKLRCSYANPATGTLSARIQGTNGTYLSLGASNSSACSVAGSDVLLKFNSEGVAAPNMLYADVGQVGLTATYTSTSGTDNGLTMSGSGSVIVAPAKFGFSAIASPQRAGQEVTSVTVTAQNKAGATTPNFGQETIKPAVALGHGYVAPKFGTQNGNADPEVSGALGFNNGVLKSSALAWAETGTINITATLSNYLGVQKIGTVTPLATGASNDVLFIPHHFQTALDTVIMPVDGFPALCGAQLACPDTGTDPRFVYSRQPFALKVTAQNLQNATTINFDKQDTSLTTQQVLLLARDAKDLISAPPANPAGSKLSDGSAAGTTLTGVPVSAFSSGVARQVLAYQFPGAYSPSTGAATLAAPTGVLLRANFTYSGSNLVTSNPSSQGKEAALTVVSGFISVPNSSGSELLPVRLDVQLKYWDGNIWRVNLADSISRFGKAQVVLANCLKQVVCSNLVVADQVYQFGTGVLAGNGRLTLQPPRVAGSVDVSVGGFSYLPSSVGRVVFGVFRSGPVLYLREMY